MEHLTDAIALSTSNHELLFTRGAAYIKQERWKEAIEDLDKVGGRVRKGADL